MTITPRDVEYSIFLSLQQYLNVACAALWVYEYICSFTLEVELIWKAVWNIPKVLYLLTRYLPVATIVLLHYYHGVDCVLYQKLLAWGVNISMCLAEVIFALRTWAIWDRSRKMAVFLSLFFLANWISSFVIISLWTSRSGPRSTNSSECVEYFIREETRLFRFLDFLFIVMFYGVTLILTCIKAYQYFKEAITAELLRVLHFDGIIYYFSIFAVSLKILILNLIAKNNIISYAGLTSGLQLTFCTVMACRMTLHLRDIGRRNIRLGSQAYTAGFSLHMDPLVFRHVDMDMGASARGIEEIPASRV